MSGTDALTPAGQYTSARLHGGFVLTAGMTPKDADGLLARGRVGEEVTSREARHLTFRATERALRAAEEAAGRASQRVADIVTLTVYLAAGEEFTAHSTVADGASEAILAWKPTSVLPARVTVGVASLPGGSPVEVQLVAAVTDR
ncbi:RidA family protein [Streptomyces sp. NRRL F-5065]|uniref:RidA family protein n=1 Tax=Streptomyces sp. NRRL F-5065 TaxID=1463855 RepID=UPI0004BF028B|nr:RidA family protein [Streptomyces sp. NRRL F-5065]